VSERRSPNRDLELPALGADGHLLDPAHWTEVVALQLAERDGVVLEERHWWLIRFVRAHFDRYGNPPLMRMAVAALREAGVENASSRTLYRLFPDGPIRLACRYGGLPAPESCI
jgi:tRNA 2-thiouridine synthesizing protein E